MARNLNRIGGSMKRTQEICHGRERVNKNNVIYNLQFGFRQQYSTSHALINITENIRKGLDNGILVVACL